MLNRKSKVKRKRKTSSKKKRRLVDFLEEVSEVLEDPTLPNYRGIGESQINLKRLQGS